MRQGMDVSNLPPKNIYEMLSSYIRHKAEINFLIAAIQSKWGIREFGAMWDKFTWSKYEIDEIQIKRLWSRIFRCTFVPIDLIGSVLALFYAYHEIVLLPDHYLLILTYNYMRLKLKDTDLRIHPFLLREYEERWARIPQWFRLYIPIMRWNEGEGNLISQRIK